MSSRFDRIIEEVFDLPWYKGIFFIIGLAILTIIFMPIAVMFTVGFVMVMPKFIFLLFGLFCVGYFIYTFNRVK